jgi:hypothetical protein
MKDDKAPSEMKMDEIKFNSIQHFGLVLLLLSPAIYALGIAGLFVFPSTKLGEVTITAMVGMFTLSPIGLIVFIIGSWINSKKSKSQTLGDMK